MSEVSEENTGSNELRSQLLAEIEESKIAELRYLAERKKAATSEGKELFDLDAFYTNYRTVDDLSGSSREEQVRRWETRYYFCSNVQTIEEFARAVEAADEHEGGDMHIE